MSLRQQQASELERLEQQITLTLQEIDRNFARAHHIVTTRILPKVERYARESENVWEGSRFWKQFFEASANVALSAYPDDDITGTYADEQTTEQQETYADETTRGEEYTQQEETTMRRDDIGDETRQEQESYEREQRGGHDVEDSLLDDSLLESLNLGHGHQSTPRVHNDGNPRWADIDSPFSAVQRELTTHTMAPPSTSQSSSMLQPPPTSRYFADLNDEATAALPPAPQTPRSVRRPGRAHSPDFSDSDIMSSSPMMPELATIRIKTPGKGQGPLQHRVLDKTWRIQATPLAKPTPSKYRTNTATGTPRSRLFADTGRSAAKSRVPAAFDSDDDIDMTDSNSPVPPELATMHFTPARTFASKQKTPKTGPKSAPRYAWDSDDSDDLILPPGFSPPKTMQFALPPSKAKLMATPAKEASRMVVNNILRTAGASFDEDESMGDAPVAHYRDEEDSFEIELRTGSAGRGNMQGGFDGFESSPPRGGRGGGFADEDPF